MGSICMIRLYFYCNVWRKKTLQNLHKTSHMREIASGNKEPHLLMWEHTGDEPLDFMPWWKSHTMFGVSGFKGERAHTHYITLHVCVVAFIGWAPYMNASRSSKTWRTKTHVPWLSLFPALFLCLLHACTHTCTHTVSDVWLLEGN